MVAATSYHAKEAKRLVGLQMIAAGKRTREVAEALDVLPATVRDWKHRLAAANGDVASAARDAPRSGRPCRLTAEQMEELHKVIVGGARAAGFEDDLWTLPRVQEIIRRKYQVSYHVNHLGKLMHKLGLSPQKPVLRACERDEEAVERFREETWPEIVKKGRMRMLS